MKHILHIRIIASDYRYPVSKLRKSLSCCLYGICILIYAYQPTLVRKSLGYLI